MSRGWRRLKAKRWHRERMVAGTLCSSVVARMKIRWAGAAGLLSRLSDGAMRDALSLLDQCGAAGGRIDGERVLDVLGLAGNVQGPCAAPWWPG